MQILKAHKRKVKLPKTQLVIVHLRVSEINMINRMIY